jgi:hypothetical protein
MMGEQWLMVTIRLNTSHSLVWSVHGVEHCYMHYSTQFDRVGFIQLVM